MMCCTHSFDLSSLYNAGNKQIGLQFLTSSTSSVSCITFVFTFFHACGVNKFDFMISLKFCLTMSLIFFFFRRKGRKGSQSVPETPNVRLTKAQSLTRMEGGPNRPRAPPARSHKRTFPTLEEQELGRTVRTLGTERDLHQAKFLKNVTALGFQRPATSNAITRKWHLVPVSNSGYLRRPLATPRPVNAETTVVSMAT